MPLQPPALPLAGHRICIDPGHGGKYPGAIGPAGTHEADVTLAVSLDLSQKLRDLGAEVRLTRQTDATVAPPDCTLKEDLQARVDVANQWPAELFVSVHCNANDSAARHGTEGYHARQASDDSKRLTRILHDHMVRDLSLKDNGVIASDFYVIKHTNMPGMLMETAYISNAQEESLLADPEFQKRIATTMATGIQEYFQAPQRDSSPSRGCFLARSA